MKEIRSILSLVVVDLDTRIYVILCELVDGSVGDQGPQRRRRCGGGVKTEYRGRIEDE